MKKRVLFVAAEPPFPTNQGGRVRMAGLISGLRADHDVDVVTWGRSEVRDAGITYQLPRPPEGAALRGVFGRSPRMSKRLFGRSPAADIRALARHYDVAMYSHSYLAAVSPLDEIPSIVDFPNIEVHRYQTFANARRGLHSWSARIEGAKARLWEPEVARRCGLATAISEVDLRWLRERDASALLVENGIVVPGPLAHSGVGARALFLASMDYEPNWRAAEWLASDVWPKVLESIPNATLAIAGRGSSSLADLGRLRGVEVLGEVEDVSDVYLKASVVLAPVVSGGGKQLKVLEALAFGRCLVATDYSLLSVPAPLRQFVVVANDVRDYARGVSTLLADRDRRHSIEAALREQAVEVIPSWTQVMQPVNYWIAST